MAAGHIEHWHARCPVLPMLTVLALSIAVLQGWPSDPAQSLVLASGPLLQDRPALASTRHGTTWVAWAERVTPTIGLVIRVEHLDSEGVSLLTGGPLAIPVPEWETSTSVTRQPSIVALDDASAVVVHPRQGEHVVTRIDRDGAPIWEHSFGGIWAQQASSLSVTPGGGILVLLTQSTVVELAADGTEQRRFALPPDPYSFYRQAFGDPTGVFIIGSSWSGGSWPSVYPWVQKRDWTGALLWSSSMNGAGLALDGVGGAAWGDLNVSGSSSLPRLVRVDAAGTFSMHDLVPQPATSVSSGFVYDVLHEPTSHHDFVAFVILDSSTGQWEIRLQRIDSAGQFLFGLDGVRVPCPPGLGSSRAAVHYDPNSERLLLIWTELSSGQSPTTIRCAGFDGNGNTHFSARDAVSTPSQKDEFAFAMSGFGDSSICIWRDGPIQDGDVHAQSVLFSGEIGPPLGFGRRYCSQVTPHSGGTTGRLRLGGSTRIADQRLLLRIDDMVPDAPAVLLAGRAPASSSQPGGSSGTLCIGGLIQHLMTGTSGSSGSLESTLDPSVLGATGGESWCFQCWFRDTVGSHFTDAVAIAFR